MAGIAEQLKHVCLGTFSILVLTTKNRLLKAELIHYGEGEYGNNSFYKNLVEIKPCLIPSESIHRIIGNSSSFAMITSNNRILFQGAFFDNQYCPQLLKEFTYFPISYQKEYLYSLPSKEHTTLKNDVKKNDFVTPMSMMVLSGFIAVVGSTLVAIAFALLQAASCNPVGLLLAGVGAVTTLSAVGLFADAAYHEKKSAYTMPNPSDNPMPL